MTHDGVFDGLTQSTPMGLTMQGVSEVFVTP
jgi:hypothetical protein